MACDFCGATSHTQNFCMDKLQIERGGRCPRCDQTSHSWRKCPTLADINCRMCQAPGHTTHSCSHSQKELANPRAEPVAVCTDGTQTTNSVKGALLESNPSAFSSEAFGSGASSASAKGEYQEYGTNRNTNSSDSNGNYNVNHLKESHNVKSSGDENNNDRFNRHNNGTSSNNRHNNNTNNNSKNDSVYNSYRRSGQNSNTNYNDKSKYNKAANNNWYCPLPARSSNVSDKSLHNQEASTSSSINERESVTPRPDAGLPVRANLNTMPEILAAVASRTRKIELGATSRPADAKSSNGISTPPGGNLAQLVERARQARDAANAVFRQPQLETGESAPAAFPRATAMPPTASRQSSAPIKDSAPQVARTNSALSSSSLQPPQLLQSLTDHNRYLTEENYLKVLELYDNDLWPTFRPFICCGCNQQVGSFEGVVLKNCMIHKSCRKCLTTRILESKFLEVTCSKYNECGAVIRLEEIMDILQDKELIQYYEQKPLRQDGGHFKCIKARNVYPLVYSLS